VPVPTIVVSAQEITDQKEVFVQCDSERLDPVVRATTTIADFGSIFLRHHEVEATTRRTYRGQLTKHVIPGMGTIGSLS
jgi:hypothetical protein